MTQEIVIVGAHDRELVADLFHALSQPLTSLRCSMEVALFEPRSPEQYRQVLQDSLELAEQITGLVGGIRSLLDSDEAIEPAGCVSLTNCLEEIAADLLPVAESAGKTLLVSTVPCHVRFGMQRLRQAVLSLLECALDSCSTGSEVIVRTEKRGREVMLRVTVAHKDVAREEHKLTEKQNRDCGFRRRVALAISRRIFESGGGQFFMEQADGASQLEVRLPLAGPSNAANFSHFHPSSETGKDLPR